MRIAMWSGPRNLSTAMMYSFGARPDFDVTDEPFYAAYLRMTGSDHPMRAQILASQAQDPAQVAAMLLRSEPGQRPHSYQKHMTQHMIKGVPRDWMKEARNIFLIRHPARVIASYAAKRDNPVLDDIGFWQQAELFDEVAGWGGDPIVVDSHDIRDDPEGMLKKLCDSVDLPFEPSMLGWPKGGHKNDGVWAQHWYGAVWNSVGFAAPEGPLPQVPEPLQNVVAAALPFYEHMKTRKI